MTSRESLALELNAFPGEVRRLLALHVVGEVGAQARLSIVAALGYVRQRIEVAASSGAITGKEHIELTRKLDRLRRALLVALARLDAVADQGEGFLDALDDKQQRFEVLL